MQNKAELSTFILSVFNSTLTIARYFASNEMAKPPPLASFIFKTSPFFTVL